MNQCIETEVIVYHDETREAGKFKLKGHVLFFVSIRTIIKETGGLLGPNERQVEPLNELIKEIREIRNNFEADHKFHFSEVSGKKWSKRNNAEKQLVQIGVEYLKQQKAFCKLGIIFYDNPKYEHIGVYGGKDRDEKELRFEETLLRMLLKGTVHYLYDETHRVNILKVVTDGQPHHRKLDEFRILDRLMPEVRNYVKFSPDAELVHLLSNHREYEEDSEEYIHANLLQLADMLLGCVVHTCFKEVVMENLCPKIGDNVRDKKGIIAYPVKEMLDKRKRGKGFKNSSHYKAFTISRAYIKNTGWEFENVMTKEINISDTWQLILLDSKGRAL